MTIAKLTANLLNTLTWRNKINEVIDDVALKQYKVAPEVSDDGSELMHVYFDDTGLRDTVTANASKWTFATEPPLKKMAYPDYAGDTTISKVGPFSSSNYFTAGTSLMNFPSAPWIAAIEVDHVNSGVAESPAGCYGGGNGWLIYTNAGDGPYILNGVFGLGVLSHTIMTEGKNTLIFGHDGTNWFLKVNGGKTYTNAAPYVAPSATGYIGYNSGLTAYSGKVIELWGITGVTPTVAVIDELYNNHVAKETRGNNKFPRLRTTRFHFQAKKYNGTTWKYQPAYWNEDNAVALPTLTKVGTVSLTTENLDPLPVKSGYAIMPGGIAAQFDYGTANGFQPLSSMHYMTGANNVMNTGGSFYGFVVVIPDTSGLLSTQVMLASGWSNTNGGWQLVIEKNALSAVHDTTIESVFIGSTGSGAAGANHNIRELPTAAKRNIYFIAYDATTNETYFKLNDNPLTIRANVTISAVTGSNLSGVRGQLNIGGHNNMDIGCTFGIVELGFWAGVPAEGHDRLSSRLMREILL